MRYKKNRDTQHISRGVLRTLWRGLVVAQVEVGPEREALERGQRQEHVGAVAGVVAAVYKLRPHRLDTMLIQIMPQQKTMNE